MGFQTRTPTSNDPPKIQGPNRWLGENEIVDEVCLLLK